MTTQSDIQELEIDIKQAKEAIALKNSLLRLKTNKDFKKVFLENYFQKEASRLVLLKADPNAQDEAVQMDIAKRLNGIGYFNQYVQYLLYYGDQMEQALKEFEETEQELLEEQL